MGYSTPKTPFSLADFLSQKALPRSYRKPAWGRKPATKLTVGESPDTDASPEMSDKENPGD